MIFSPQALIKIKCHIFSNYEKQNSILLFEEVKRYPGKNKKIFS